MTIEAELQRRRVSDGALVSWTVNDDGTEPVRDPQLDITLSALRDAIVNAVNALEALTVTGTVAVSNLPATQLVTGTVTVNNPTANPETGLAKELTLAQVHTRLGDIFNAVDGLEVTAGNIEINSDTLNLQTDEVESLLRAVRDNLAGLARDVTVADLQNRLQDIKRAVTDFETRLDYADRADGNPVYVGKALQGAVTTDATWIIQRLEYDTANRLIRVQVLTGAWTNRLALTWG